MEISWLGDSCFRLKSKEIALITDPSRGIVGREPPLSADIVTVSHGHPRHNAVEAVKGVRRVVERPGEYEISDVLITGVASWHDSNEGQRLGKNTIYLIEIDAIVLCHLGDLGHIPTEKQRELLGAPDILLLPVGGVTTLDGATAAEVVRLLEPRVVIPMHYRSMELGQDLEPVDRFLREMGLGDLVPQPKLSVTKANLPQERQTVVLGRS